MNSIGTTRQKYDRTTAYEDFGFWAYFIHPIAMAEGGFYHTLNTYDRAHFTFSFLQFAAHVPNGDFIIYLRELLKLPLASEYFPDLALVNGRISRITDFGLQQVESDESTALLVEYLNPSTKEVEDTEIIQAAKFIHWAQNDSAHRLVQLKVGIRNFRNRMVNYAKRYQLDGADDVICLLITDIRHQGRATSSEIISALHSIDPFESLLKIGEPRYKERIKVLRREIKAMVAQRILGQRTYSLANEDFS